VHIVDVEQCECNAVEMEGCRGVQIQWLLAAEECGAPNFAMRRFIVEPGGHTPLHTHDWEHEVYIVRGCGEITHGDEVSDFAADTALLVEPGEEHQFRNTGDEPLEFLCLVPNGPATER
jgi:quercetin dioxygenase-like cupin family protein